MISYVTENGKKRKTVATNAKTSIPQSVNEVNATYEVKSAEHYTPEAKAEFVFSIKKKFGIRKIMTSLLWILPVLLFVSALLYGIFDKQGIFTTLMVIAMVAFFLDVAALIFSPLYLRVKVRYEFDDEYKDYLESLDEAINCLKACSKLWRITAYTNIDRKTNGGATKSLDMEEMSVSKKKPWFISTNAKCYCLKSKKEKCYILPNTFIVQRKNKVGAFELKDICFLITDSSFTTSRNIKDGNLIRYTYTYVNKDGSRDMRYKNNPQLNVYQVANVEIKTEEGFDMLMQLSNVYKAVEFSEIVTAMIKKYDPDGKII